MLKAYKYRMYPNSTQRLALAKTFGCVRYIYNKGIEAKTKAYETKGELPHAKATGLPASQALTY
jgi:putative transposase